LLSGNLTEIDDILGEVVLRYPAIQHKSQLERGAVLEAIANDPG
jgi:hypothetical protein